MAALEDGVVEVARINPGLCIAPQANQGCRCETGQAWFWPVRGGGLFLNLSAVRVRWSAAPAERVWAGRGVAHKTGEPAHADFVSEGVEAYVFEDHPKFRQPQIVMKLATPATPSGTCPPGLPIVGGCVDFFGRAMHPDAVNVNAVIMRAPACADPPECDVFLGVSLALGAVLVGTCAVVAVRNFGKVRPRGKRKRAESDDLETLLRVKEAEL